MPCDDVRPLVTDHELPGYRGRRDPPIPLTVFSVKPTGWSLPFSPVFPVVTGLQNERKRPGDTQTR